MKEQYDDNTITPIGITDWRNTNIPFGIRDKDRLRHIYVIGKTGVGKSTLLQNMAISDIQRGNGLCIIDPHGDIVESLLNYIPEERIKDVIYFNPTDIEHPVAFNPLDQSENKHLIATGLISTFKKIWSESWGPRLEYILHFALLTLLEYPNTTLLDIQQLLTDKEFRQNILSKSKNTNILSFWYNEFDTYPHALRLEAISPILNKVGVFRTNTILQNILGQAASSFSLKQVLKERKIILCNLSKGLIGEEVSSVLGSILITAIQMEIMQRAGQPQHTRIPFYLYVDEMHSFVSLSLIDVLAEARKYGLSLFLTHQYIEQLHEKIRSAIFGNVGTLITFAVGNEDAILLEKEFKPVFDATDLINLSKYSMYVKLMIDGKTSKPFSAISTPLPISQPPSFSKKLLEYSRLTYSTYLSATEPIFSIDGNFNMRVVQGTLF